MARTQELLNDREQFEPASLNRLEVRTWRRQRWLTQPQLAQLLGVRPQTVYRWESGESSVPSFLKLALDQLDMLHYWSPDGIDALPRLGPVS
jgi:DNA-binding transcriptional regulator YiaG